MSDPPGKGRPKGKATWRELVFPPTAYCLLPTASFQKRLTIRLPWCTIPLSKLDTNG